jgi:hypothetical protein
LSSRVTVGFSRRTLLYVVSIAMFVHFKIQKTKMLHTTFIGALMIHLMSRRSSIDTATGYELEDRGSGFRFLAGLGIFLFSTQLPIQWVPRALSPG